MAVLMTITLTYEDTDSLTQQEAHKMVDPVVEFIRNFAQSQLDAAIVTTIDIDYAGANSTVIKVT